MPKQTAQTTYSLQVQGDWYHVRRRGSRYNILGPAGRVFASYKSASDAGPRWEELTHTPWPHESSAYQPGLRLAQLGLTPHPAAPETPPQAAAPPEKPGPAHGRIAHSHIARYHIAKVRRPRALLAEPVQERLQDPTIRALLERESHGSGPDARRARQALEAIAISPADAAFEVRCGETPVAGPYPSLAAARAVKAAILDRDRDRLLRAAESPPGLPGPRFDLAAQRAIVQRIQRQPLTALDADARPALERERDYHRPQAAWAATVLAALDEASPDALRAALEDDATALADPAALLDSLRQPPLPNVLDVYHDPALALHPDADPLRAMLREEAAGAGLLAHFAQTLLRVLDAWADEPERLRTLLERQRQAVRQGAKPALDPLVEGPAQYRAWRIRQNRQRNLQRAARIDAQAVLTQHLAWQAGRLGAEERETAPQPG